MKHVNTPKEPLDTQNNMGLKASQKLAWELNQKKQVGVETWEEWESMKYIKFVCETSR